MSPIKFCKACKEEKEHVLFYKHALTKDKLHPTCKACCSEAGRKNYFANKELRSENGKEYHYKYKYGITRSDVCKAKEAQDNRCPICLEQGVLVVDHDHKRKHKVRGFLCHKCNQALGSLKDNPESFIRAAEYLRSYYATV